ncbi:hypothetical protein R6Q57_026764 [Mikania cordata]
MKVIAAYLLALLGGNTCPSADDLKNILGSGKTILLHHLQAPFHDKKFRLNLLTVKMNYTLVIEALCVHAFWILSMSVFNMLCELYEILIQFGADADEDRIELLLSEVKGKDITELIAAGREKLASVPSGGGGVAVAAAAGGGGAPAAAAAAEPKKDEKVEEKEESDDDMGFSLFD